MHEPSDLEAVVLSGWPIRNPPRLQEAAATRVTSPCRRLLPIPPLLPLGPP